MSYRLLAFALLLLPVPAFAGVKEKVAAMAPSALVLVVDEKGNELIAQNADQPFVPASVTKIVDGLVQKGLLSRTAHPTDRRAQVLAPTAQAAEKIDASYARFHAAVVDVLEQLPDADNAVLADSLTKIVDALAAGTPAPVDEYTVDDQD